MNTIVRYCTLYIAEPLICTHTHTRHFTAKLSELRDSTLAVFGVANTLWIILILTLVPKSQLNVLGTNALGKRENRARARAGGRARIFTFLIIQ